MMDQKRTSRDISFVSEGEVFKKSERTLSTENMKDIENEEADNVDPARREGGAGAAGKGE